MVSEKSATPHGSRRFVLLGLAGLLTLALAAGGTAWFMVHQPGRITEFSVPTANIYPTDITAGPDGNLWFTEYTGNQIWRITPSGTITKFVIPSGNAARLTLSGRITAGPDGNLWFTEVNNSQIGRVTPSGTITEFPLPTPINGASTALPVALPVGITAGPDGNLWFTEIGGNEIGRISPSGTVAEFPILSSISLPQEITAGPDGNLWFTEIGGNKIGRITTSGKITEFPVPTAVPTDSSGQPEAGLQGIAAGSDGNLWFIEEGANKIGRITPSGKITEFALRAGSDPSSITAGPDGNLWFTEIDGNKIGRISPSGTITQFPLPRARSGPGGITAGPDGNLWFTEIDGKIGRITSGRLW